MNSKDAESSRLIQIAIDTVREHYEKVKQNHTVASAILCEGGKVYKGINIHSNHGYCAEIIALGAALTAGEKKFCCIASVNNEEKIIPPCGLCRQILYEYACDCSVIVSYDHGAIYKKQ